MDIFCYVLLIFAGFLLLLFGAEYLLCVANFCVRWFGASPIFIGATILAVGTSLPEVGVSLYSALMGVHEACFSNITGSNIFNMCIVLGTCALIKPIKIRKEYFRNEIFQHIGLGILLFFLAYGGALNRGGGIILLMCYAFLVCSWYLRNNGVVAEGVGKECDGRKLVIVVKLFASAPMFFLGTKLVVDNGLLLAEKVGLSNSFAGFTIMAVGTCLPELVTGVLASKRGQNEYVLGNVFASNICNITVGLGLSATVVPLKLVAVSNMRIQLIALLIITAIITFFTYTKYVFSRMEGGLVIILYIIVLKTIFY